MNAGVVAVVVGIALLLTLGCFVSYNRLVGADEAHAAGVSAERTPRGAEQNEPAVADNMVVAKLNRRIDAFPSNVVARRMQMPPAEYFQRD